MPCWCPALHCFGNDGSSSGPKRGEVSESYEAKGRPSDGSPHAARKPEGPIVRGTVAQSMEAAGPWLHPRELRSPPMKQGWCWERYRGQTQKDGPVRDAFMACSVRVPTDRAYDSGKRLGLAKNAPDLNVVVSVANEPAAYFRGEHNEYAACVALPMVTLNDGDEVRMRLWDRNPVNDVDIGTVAGTFSGTLPLELELDGIEATCNIIPADVIDEQLASKALPALDERIETMGRARGGRAALPSLIDNRQQVRWLMNGAARYVGWADSRVERRRNAVREAHKGLLARQAALLTEGPQFEFGKGALKGVIESIECGVESTEESFPLLEAPMAWPVPEPGCRLVGTVEAGNAGSDEIIAGSQHDLLTAYLFTTTGAMIELEPHADHGGFFGSEINNSLVEKDVPRGKNLPLRFEAAGRPIDFQSEHYGGAWRLWLQPRDWESAENSGALLPLDGLAVKGSKAK